MAHVIGVSKAETYTSAQYRLGDVYVETENGIEKEFVFVQLSASAQNAAVAGTVLYYTTNMNGVVTDDISTTKQNLWAGIAIGAIAKGSYGWIQYDGPMGGIAISVSSAAIGDAMIGHSTTDGKATNVAADTAPTNKVIGIFTTAAASAGVTSASALLGRF